MPNAHKRTSCAIPSSTQLSKERTKFPGRFWVGWHFWTLDNGKSLVLPIYILGLKQSRWGLFSLQQADKTRHTSTCSVNPDITNIILQHPFLLNNAIDVNEDWCVDISTFYIDISSTYLQSQQIWRLILIPSIVLWYLLNVLPSPSESYMWQHILSWTSMSRVGSGRSHLERVL